MGGTFFIFLLTIANVSLLLNSVIAGYPEKGFSIKMIHRDSKESPLYSGDHLTRNERLQRLVEQSNAQARYVESQILLQRNETHSKKFNVARLPIVYEARMFYVAMVGLGTFPDTRQPFKNYYLIIDSGSSQTWLQCEGATKAFYQDVPFYPWNSSTTYRPIPCNTHPLCQGNTCNEKGQCTYISHYASGSTTSGIIAEEKFTLGSNAGGLESINLRMGCGIRQENFDYFLGNNHKRGKLDIIAGILGLGRGQWSFLNQLGVVGQGKFSYCLETFNDKIQGSDTYLRFGKDATIGGVFQKVYTTPLVFPQSNLYYLNLEDISVGNKRVNFYRGTFALNNQGEGGTTIDSGAPISVMYKDQFDRVADLVKSHFNELGIEYIGTQGSFDVCFRLRGKFDITNYPSITLHFQQANYVIPDYKANFLQVSAGTICLGIFRGDTKMPVFTLGAMQQTNKRILYNLINNSLSFATEYCELGS